MPASNHLNSNQFLHGSPTAIEIGAEILPAAQLNMDERMKRRAEQNVGYRPDRVYMVQDPISAYQYTWTDEDIQNKRQIPSGYIHIVEPSGRLLRDTSSRHAIVSNSRHAKGAKVVGRFPARMLAEHGHGTPEEQEYLKNYVERFK